nr:Na+/H+ antiporter NhaC family protein [uncultured Capnocytophaga sp.]
MNFRPTFTSIIPLLIFVAFFLGSGLYFDNFYSLPAPIIALFAVVVALLLYRSPLEKKIGLFFKGAGDKNVLQMCVIALLAGAFASVAKASGSIDSIVNMGMYYISPEYFPVGIFVIAAFLSFATGTSVGTIMTLSPIVFGLASESHSGVALIGASLLSGAMFGDNLSLISDTTIAATQSLGCKMSEKMKANARVALPMALLTVVILLFIGNPGAQAFNHSEVYHDFNVVLILPYVAVVVISLFGVNVFVSLFLGVLLSGVIGLVYGKFDFLSFTQYTYKGFMDMADIFFLYFIIGGLALLVEHFGGIQFLMNLIAKRVKSERSGLLGMGFLVSVADMCVANNTVAILIVSKISKRIAEQFGVPLRSAASVLDIFSCYVQGLIPYGAQVIALYQFAHNMDYLELVMYSVYLHLLLVGTLLFIRLQGSRREELGVRR